MCAIDDADPCTIYATVDRRARKTHLCFECARTIAPGERYREARMLDDGRWDTFRTCGHCAQVQAWLVHQCGGFLHGYTLDDLWEHWDEDTVLRCLDFGRLIVHSRNRRTRRRWRTLDGTLVPVEAVEALVLRLVAT